MSTTVRSTRDIAALLDRWAADGVVTADQAERMRADLRAPGRVPARPLVAEAMGYLGGAIVVAALGLLAGWFWADLTLAARLALVGAAALLVGGAGAAVPRRLGASGARLRAVLWLAACVALTGFLALLAADGFGWQRDAVTAFAAAVTAAVAGGLWAARPHAVQHAAFLLLVIVAAAACAALLPGNGTAAGVAVWAVGSAWAILGWGALVRPARFGLVLGAVAAMAGVAGLVGEPWGAALALVTLAAAVAGAVALRDLVLLAVAAVGTLNLLPAIVVQFFPSVLAVALVLLLVGLLLVAAAVLIGRRRSAVRHQDSRGLPVVPPSVAVGAAAFVVVAGGVLAVLS
ncbi:DUF2157 domain-containing protein [Spirilliplanes yamanashiensis]|uniref:DUF2157 domain-containing protein n=1 Tax=Spirilliplanes yamanashiensis TaxID=42233 RepID=A0A8J3YFL4_9ACTN|nr:DUF2157 domain-containing protein [Spirilliplanes yamanashiensis]MDP9818318.1 hypothetical protein [Spirilliplanes yamanashiensis]GIJ06773.1 hypothetical protein Sya03_61250 [Spirilliplanes yamanashiensis]